MKETHNSGYIHDHVAYLKGRFTEGLKAIPHSPLRMILVAALLCGVIAVFCYTGSPSKNMLDKLCKAGVFLCVAPTTPLVFVSALTLTAIPTGGYRFAQALQGISLVNANGTPPRPVQRIKDGQRERVELFAPGLPMQEFQERRAKIESTLGQRITAIEEGRDCQHVILGLAPGNTKLPERVVLPDKPSATSSILLAGVSLDGEVTVDLNRTPHLLVGGSTGSGKTTLVKTFIQQLLSKAEVSLVDMKGGLDYPPQWREAVNHLCTDHDHALAVLTELAGELDRRMELFQEASARAGTSCDSLDAYNRIMEGSEFPLPRKVVVVDELAELTDTTGADKVYKERSAKMVEALGRIARLGRAFGINLILATQRPDANVVPGQIKSNLDCRICGKADDTLSMIILDNTEANDQIPKDSQGLFLIQGGTLFRGYLPSER